MQLGGDQSRLSHGQRTQLTGSSRRWLFFIEGGLTCTIAIVSFYIIPDFPTTPAS